MLSKKEIKKWSNEQKVEALAKFVALRSFDPDKALLYGYMLDDLLDEINKKQRKINKLETNNKKLIEKLEEDIKILGNYEERKQMSKEQLFENDAKWFYAAEILKFAKGEKE